VAFLESRGSLKGGGYIMEWYFIVMVLIVLGIIIYSIKKEKKK